MLIHLFFIHKPLDEEQESEESPDGEEEGDESDLVSSLTFSNFTKYQKKQHNQKSFRCNALIQKYFTDLNFLRLCFNLLPVSYICSPQSSESSLKKKWKKKAKGDHAWLRPSRKRKRKLKAKTEGLSGT